ncbi:hypothetical protein [Burkholderia seminalis]|uniref:Uncharacterized protein n=2 Tax=Burkholderia cepacia complex TaxID=87882 RepID=A0A8A8CXQ6_9BURK|nr:hypothetical protein [Burkholderia seminalis]QTO17418.1 hypothetical protein DT99_009860 [Burkholderia seminalis]
MQRNSIVNWAFGIKGAIESTVRDNFPSELRTWPLMQSFVFDAYALTDNYAVYVLRDKLSGVVAGKFEMQEFPHPDWPSLPPQPDQIELWQFFFRDRFQLREEDVAVVFPLHDSGTNDPSKDYELFTTEEQYFWSAQISYIVGRYKAHLDTMSKNTPTYNQNITYNVNGTNSRVNVNSTDSSTNVVSSDTTKVFADLRSAIQNIPDPTARQNLVAEADGLEKAHHSGGFLQKYQAFMASASDHITVLGAVLPALAGLLSTAAF